MFDAIAVSVPVAARRYTEERNDDVQSEPRVRG
jgi:hypothetical protein